MPFQRKSYYQLLGAGKITVNSKMKGNVTATPVLPLVTKTVPVSKYGVKEELPHWHNQSCLCDFFYYHLTVSAFSRQQISGDPQRNIPELSQVRHLNLWSAVSKPVMCRAVYWSYLNSLSKTKELVGSVGILCERDLDHCHQQQLGYIYYSGTEDTLVRSKRYLLFLLEDFSSLCDQSVILLWC